MAPKTVIRTEATTSKAVAKPQGVKSVLVDRDDNVEDDSFGEDVPPTQAVTTKKKSASETYTRV